MGLQSDISITASKFNASSISPKTQRMNEYLMEIMAKGPKWYEVRIRRRSHFFVQSPKRGRFN